MKGKNLTYSSAFVVVCFLSACNANSETDNFYVECATKTLDAIYSHYSIDESCLLRETYPFDQAHRATYLANEEQADLKKPYSYLWPFSGSLSAVSALFGATGDKKYLELFDNKVFPGLKMYYDTRRFPDAYASYINTAPLSDRFYDDNIWIGIDFTDMYLQTRNSLYIEKAKVLWTFIESGMDSILGGGIYWVEQRKGSKHTCSNAPAVVYALKLYEATDDEAYLEAGKILYEWTKKHLQDPEDYLYYDNIRLNGRLDKKKYAYNSGQMIQAGALLYKQTRNEQYLKDAQRVAKSSYQYFFHDFEDIDGEKFRMLNRSDVWFSDIMFRGFIELYNIDNNREYIEAFQKNLNYSWKYMRDENGLFNSDWSGKTKDQFKWILTQFAMVEMYARMSELAK